MPFSKPAFLETERTTAHLLQRSANNQLRTNVQENYALEFHLEIIKLHTTPSDLIGKKASNAEFEITKFHLDEGRTITQPTEIVLLSGCPESFEKFRCIQIK